MTTALSLLRSFRMQNLLVEFASLKHVQLQGIYLSLIPRDPSVWTGTLFVRKGVYAPAVLRFRITFPSIYPFAPPIITFNSDIFHPLLTPSTTYGYASSAENENRSNKEDERLPPGALSLKHRFAAWFRGAPDSRSPSNQTPTSPNPQTPAKTSTDTTNAISNDQDLNIVEVLRYMRSCFEDEALLDSIPFEASANPGAWYAWQSYRGRSTKNTSTQLLSTGSASSESNRSADADQQPVQSRAKRPSEWNWEGVWIERVKKAVQNSLTEQVLYGSNTVKDDGIHFLDADDEATGNMRAEMRARTTAGA